MAYPSPLHTRFRVAPSGDCHIGHWVLGKLSMEAARLTGGTFTMKSQYLWATREIETWEKFEAFAHKNLEDLQALGVEPSHPNAFLAHGMSPDWRIQYTDDRGLIDAYWHALHLDDLWGNWPNDPRLVGPEATEVMPCDYLSWNLTQLSSKHPYLQFAQMVGEITTGRNCLIRGSDHIQDKAFADAFYPLIAKIHYRLPDWDRQCQYTPAQFFLSRIGRTGGDTISSSSGPGSAGFYVKDIIAAGVPPDKLWKFMGRVLWGSYENAEKVACDWSQQIPMRPEQNHLRGGPQSGARSVMESILPIPRINDEEWDRFCRSGGKVIP